MKLRIAVLSAEGRTAKSTIAVGLLDLLSRDSEGVPDGPTRRPGLRGSVEP